LSYRPRLAPGRGTTQPSVSNSSSRPLTCQDLLASARKLSTVRCYSYR